MPIVQKKYLLLFIFLIFSTLLFAQPTITSYSPISSAGGKLITITGTNFTGITDVRFSGFSVSYTVVSPTTITATMPYLTSTNITVYASSQSATIPTGVTYIPYPTISSLSPNNGTEGSVIDINGTNLVNADSVIFPGEIPASFTVVSASKIKAVVPPGTTTGYIRVVTPGGSYSSGYSFNTFNYVLPPQITSFSPASGVAGTQITLTGNYLHFVRSVTVGGVPATFVSSNTTSMVLRLVSGGTGDIVVNTGGGTATIAGFKYIYPPQVTSIDPASAATGSVVTITGSNFENTSAVKFGGTAATSFTVVSPTTIQAVIGSGTSGDVSITTPGGSTSFAGFTYLYSTPVISSVSPLNATSGNTVTIVGHNFQNVNAVKFGGVAARSFIVVSADTITAVVNTGLSGNIAVSNPATTTNYPGFIYTGPLINYFSTNYNDDDYTTIIEGTNFNNVSGVSFGGIPAKSFIVNSSTSITAKVGTGRSGDITVQTALGTAAIAGFLYKIRPTLASFTPLKGSAGTAISITGTNFTGVTAVKFGNIAASSFTINSPYNITAIVGNNASGDVSVQTTGGTASLSGFEFISSPVINSFTPTTGTTGTIITISGSNFTNATNVTVGGIAASSFTVVSPTSITATIGNVTTSGSLTVMVTTPLGTASKTGFIITTAPTISSITPNGGGSGSLIIINGTNFTGVTSVSFGGVAARSFTVVNTNTITAIIENGATGNVSVTTTYGTATFAGFTYTTASSYCNPSTTGNYPGRYEITRVQFAGIDKSTGSESSHYTDYSTTVSPGKINAGSSASCTVSCFTYYSASIGVWIDYNQNNIFETSEFTLLGSSDGSPITTVVTIPLNAVGGLTRMRVKLITNNGGLKNTDACLASTSGETEDYNIFISKVIISHIPEFTDTLKNPTITLKATIKQDNVGINVTEELKPTLWAKTYNSTVWKSFKGVLASGTANNGNWLFTVNHDSLGIIKNIPDSVMYYFVAQDNNTPANVGYSPLQGALHSNVQTQVYAPTIPFLYKVLPRLRDTVFVNKFQNGFSSISGEGGLFQYINNKKLENNLTVLIESDLDESGKYELFDTSLHGYSIKIQSDKSVLRTLTATDPGYASILKLDGVKNLTIDGSVNGTGKYLKLKNEKPSSANYAGATSIKLYNSCNTIFIKNLIIESISGSTDSTESPILISNGTNKNIFIESNLFQAADTAKMPDRYITSILGTNTILIKKNEFNNFRQSSIKLAYGSEYCIIDSNHFYRTNILPTSASNIYGYYVKVIYTNGPGHSITNNYIGGQGPYCTGNALNFTNGLFPAEMFAINTDKPIGTAPVIISGNTIDNISINATLSVAGIVSYNKGIISKNIIGSLNSTSPTIITTSQRCLGIVAASPQQIDVTENIITAITTRGLFKGIQHNNVLDGGTSSVASCNVSKNKVYNISNTQSSDAPSGDYSPNIGIYIRGGMNNIIEQNEVHDISSGTAGGNVTGITYIGYNSLTLPSASKIQRNRIYNFTNGSNIQSSCCNEDDVNGKITGLFITNDGGNQNNTLDIINNQVYLTNDTLVRPVTIRGIDLYSGSAADATIRHVSVLYNTVYIGGKASGNGGSSTFSSSTLRAKEISNNIFFNERTGGTKGHYAHRNTDNFYMPNYYNSATTGTNNLYILKDTAKFALWSTSPQTAYNYTYWKNSTKLDSNSYLMKADSVPSAQFFVDKTTCNLNINTSNEISWYANNKAKPVANITADFDADNIRSTTQNTDIGSDEFDTNTLPPGTKTYCVGDNIIITSTATGSSYQWQLSADSVNFSNIANDAIYSGVNTATLTLTTPPSSYYGYQYKCVTDGNTSLASTILFTNYWTGSISSAWENPGNWSCNIVPDANTDVKINTGTITLNSNGICRSMYLKPSVNFTIQPGATLTITH